MYEWDVCNISLGAFQNLSSWCRPLFKKSEKMKIENFILSNEKMKLWREVFNSTCLPSGNLVDGLPLDLHNTDARGYWFVLGRALKYFFLPCDPAGKINSLYNEKVYHSECSFICMNEMCVNIKPGAYKNEAQTTFQISENIEKMKIWNFTLSNEKMKKYWRVFNSTCLPSGNLVDGLPLDLHNTDAMGYWLLLGPALFCGRACTNVVADK